MIKDSGYTLFNEENMFACNTFTLNTKIKSPFGNVSINKEDNPLALNLNTCIKNCAFKIDEILETYF